MGIRISKDHLHPSVIESITSLIGDLNQLETTAKGNAVEAINELLANGGNKEELEALIAEIAEGKELIANAVGEPLTAEESFDEMSNDINSLLSTFKTNMMNNGITVESGDRFKSLIDKIATMVEEGSGKDIQFASGTGTVVSKPELSSNGDFIEVDSLSFKPTIILAHFDKNTHVFFDSTDVDNNNGEGYFLINSAGVTRTTLDDDSIVTDSGFRLWIYGLSRVGLEYNWVAIGVGEEDTTIRDSLASILENKGVEVTEEDDMASLITKVDGIPKVTQVVASDNVLMTIQQGQSQRTFGYQDTIARFTCLFEGSIRAFVNARVNQSYTDIMYFELFRDGVIIETGWANVPAHTTIGSNLYYDFNDIKLGDEIQIRFKSTISTNVVYVLEPGLRGDIVK